MSTSLVGPLLTATITGLCRTSAAASQLQQCSAIDQMIYWLISVLNILTTTKLHSVSYILFFFGWLEYVLFWIQWNYLIFFIISSLELWQSYDRNTSAPVKVPWRTQVNCKRNSCETVRVEYGNNNKRVFFLLVNAWLVKNSNMYVFRILLNQLNRLLFFG